jgi:CDP-diacylglycerol--glycerol-3-phosphate 3-phosphatidyltransferase
VAFERVGKRKKRKSADLAREATFLPNLLTFGRIGCIPLILYFIDNYSPFRSFIAMLIYLGASLTDFLDGWLARRRKQVSILGKFLDPLADKLMVTSVLVYLTAMDRVPPALVVALLARELSVTGLRAIAVAEGLVISASDSGKQKTALQMVATMFLLIHFRYPLWGVEVQGDRVMIDFHAVGIVTLYLALVMSLLSGIDYFLQFAKAVKRTKKEPPPPASPTSPATSQPSAPPPEAKP